MQAVWYAAEAFGDLVGLGKRAADPAGAAAAASPAAAQLPRADALSAIRADYDVDYFISGRGAMAAYDPDCEFADPFVSFRGAPLSSCPTASNCVRRRQRRRVVTPRSRRRGRAGVGRFKKNVSNLGGLMEDVKLELLDWREEPAALVTRWRFACTLQLPWRRALPCRSPYSPARGRRVPPRDACALPRRPATLPRH